MVSAEPTLAFDLQRVFDAQRKNAAAIALTTAAERAEKLKVLLDYLMAHLTDIEKAMYDDFRKPACIELKGGLIFLKRTCV